MNVVKQEPSYVGSSYKITMSDAIEYKRYDWIVFLVKKWNTSSTYSLNWFNNRR